MNLSQNKILPWIIVGIFIVVTYGIQLLGFEIAFDKIILVLLLLMSLGILIKALFKFRTIKKINFISLIGGAIILLYYSWSGLTYPLHPLGSLDAIIIVSALIALLPAGIDMAPQQAKLYQNAISELQGVRNRYVSLSILALIILTIFIILFLILLNPVYKFR